MILHYGYDNLNLTAPVVTLGIFDGVHRGHRVLLDTLVLRAKEEGGESVVITFFPHPRLVLEKDHLNLFFLTTMDEKIHLLREAGVDHLIILEFSTEFSKIEACDFVKQILVDKVGTKHLIIGYNHHFGWKGEGDFNTIRECSNKLNFSVEQVEGFSLAAGGISSSVIRTALLKGKVEEANELLGYMYSLTGIVVAGKQLGRALGFPTANIQPQDPHKLIPVNGVYAVEVLINEKRYAGMLSIGLNPTVNTNPGQRSIEVHIFDFEEDIYGQEITLIFRKWLRDEEKFASLEQLTEQMKLDRDNTLKFLS
jgi:riboflavin kinase/FMN adenylyltransferase